MRDGLSNGERVILSSAAMPKFILRRGKQGNTTYDESLNYLGVVDSINGSWSFSMGFVCDAEVFEAMERERKEKEGPVVDVTNLVRDNKESEGEKAFKSFLKLLLEHSKEDSSLQTEIITLEGREGKNMLIAKVFSIKPLKDSIRAYGDVKSAGNGAFEGIFSFGNIRNCGEMVASFHKEFSECCQAKIEIERIRTWTEVVTAKKKVNLGGDHILLAK